MKAKTILEKAKENQGELIKFLSFIDLYMVVRDKKQILVFWKNPDFSFAHHSTKEWNNNY